MGVFSYLSLKRPANLIWKAFSPGRDIGEEKEEEGGSEGNLNSSGGDISLASAASASGETPVVRLKDIVKEEVKRDWFIRRGSEATRGNEEGGWKRLEEATRGNLEGGQERFRWNDEGGQERLVGGRNFDFASLNPGQQRVTIADVRLQIILKRMPGFKLRVDESAAVKYTFCLGCFGGRVSKICPSLDVRRDVVEGPAALQRIM